MRRLFGNIALLLEFGMNQFCSELYSTPLRKSLILYLVQHVQTCNQANRPSQKDEARSRRGVRFHFIRLVFW
jgi:hypothetical protein